MGRAVRDAGDQATPRPSASNRIGTPFRREHPPALDHVVAPFRANPPLDAGGSVTQVHSRDTCGNIFSTFWFSSVSTSAPSEFFFGCTFDFLSKFFDILFPHSSDTSLTR